MPTIKFHRGSLTLKALRDECQALQEHDVTKLVHLQGANVENAVNNENKFNQAQYADLNGDFTKIPRLTFMAVTDASQIPTIISDQLKPTGGGNLIFDEILFIEGKEQRTLGFGKLP
jgi:hypothetical protein